MTLYFLRHGQSLANIQGNFAGQRDNSPLTELGIQQAKDAGKMWNEKGISLDKIISSPLIRARKTAEIFANEIGFSEEILIDEKITEYDMGELSGQPSKDISAEKLRGAQGAEYTVLFMQRIRAALEAYSMGNQNILLVSNGGVGRMIYCIQNDIESSLFYDYKIPGNAEVIVLNF